MRKGIIMKIILSRKGFDNSNGGCPSPILPDGTMISMPIPSDDNDKYENLAHDNISYLKLLENLNPKQIYNSCHLDPDIRDDVRKTKPSNWKPAFGQINSAQGTLKNAGVEKGDLFLFFGWFKKCYEKNGTYSFYTKKTAGDFYDYADLHAIYGYMQIGEILTDKEQIKKYSWHPHAADARLQNKKNALYIPAEKLSFCPSMKGYGTFDFSKKRVLTKEGYSRAKWIKYPFLEPEHIYGRRKNSAKSNQEALYYAGIWQELIVYESPEIMEWVKEIIK